MYAFTRKIEQSFRLAWLVPLRIGIVAICSIASVCVVLWDQVETNRALAAQESLTRFVGEKGWRASLKPQDRSRYLPTKKLLDSVAFLEDGGDAPIIFVLYIPVSIRTSDAVRPEIVRIGLATRASGLSDSLPTGEVPCVWLGAAARQEREWIVSEKLRCGRISTPSGWHSIAAEAGSDLLILPISSGNLIAGAAWQRSVELVLGSRGFSCEQMTAVDEAIECSGLAASLSTSNHVAKKISGWSRFVAPGVFGVLMLSIAYYVHGLLPMLMQIFALRLALGQSTVVALSDALSGIAWQIIFIGFLQVFTASIAGYILGVENIQNFIYLSLAFLLAILALVLFACGLLMFYRRNSASSTLVNWQ